MSLSGSGQQATVICMAGQALVPFTWSRTFNPCSKRRLVGSNDINMDCGGVMWTGSYISAVGLLQ